MIDIRWAQFHDAVFHAGKNYTNKVEVARHSGLRIQFDEDKRRFVFTNNGRTSYLPETSAFIWEPVTDAVKTVVNEHKTEDKSKRSRAQVSTPQSHVFEGRGQGLK